MALKFSHAIVAKVRKGEGWSLAEAGRRVGVSPRKFKGWEEGRSEPSLTEAFGLAAAFGKDVDHFMA